MTADSSSSVTPTDSRNIYQWEIWEIVWEHEDSTSKARRALVLSSTPFNSTSNEIWFAKISTKKHEVAHRIELKKTDASFVGTGLTETSFFYLANARKISRDKIIKRKGRLNSFSALVMAIEVKKAVKGLQ